MGTKGLLLTLILTDNFVDASKLAQQVDPTATLDTLVDILRSDEVIQASWPDLQAHGQNCMQQAAARDVAVSLEVCPDTWRLQKVMRLHAHMFLKSTTDNLRLNRWARSSTKACALT